MAKIDRLWAFVVEDKDSNDEGVISFRGLPLVGADVKYVASMRPVAQQIADVSHKAVRLIHFSVRTEVETLVPHAGERNGH